MTKKILSSIFGAFVFAVLLPLGYWLIFKELPLDGFFASIALLAAIGLVVGAILGAMFPRVFGFIFEMFVDF